MPRAIVLASPADRLKRGNKKRTEGAPEGENTSHTFSFSDSVYLFLPETEAVWEALARSGDRHLVVEEGKPEAQPAIIVPISSLKGDALAAVERALTDLRSTALNDEAEAETHLLAKPLDSIYERQQEWLAVRTFLAANILRLTADEKPSSKARTKSKRVFLLIDG